MRSSSAGSATAPDEGAVQRRRDVPLALARRVDDGAELVGVDRPQRDARGAEADEVAHDVLVGGGEQHDDRRMRTQAHEPAHDVDDVEVGGRAHHDEVGPVDRGQADELATRPGLRPRPRLREPPAQP